MELKRMHEYDGPDRTYLAILEAVRVLEGAVEWIWSHCNTLPQESVATDSSWSAVSHL